MATIEQLDDARRLMRLLGVNPFWVERFAGCSISDLTEDQADKVICALAAGEFGIETPLNAIRRLAKERWGEMYLVPLTNFVYRICPEVSTGITRHQAAHVAIELDREMEQEATEKTEKTERLGA